MTRTTDITVGILFQVLHTKDLKRMNDFISGFTFAIVRQDEKESEKFETKK